MRGENMRKAKQGDLGHRTIRSQLEVRYLEVNFSESPQ